MRRGLFALAVVVLLTQAAAGQPREALPPELVRLRDVAPHIVQDMRYAGAFNFTGMRVPGYLAAECILWRPAAEALGRAQAQLEAEGFRLKVYDCYRPAQAVRAFAAWSKQPGHDEMKPVFYPGFDKSRLFALGYIASRSKHSLAIAVDIGMVRTDEADSPTPREAGACDGPFELRAKESSLDFGTAYDCFSASSATASRAISAQARGNRDRLLGALEREGFRNYDREWWHFELQIRGAPTRPYDVPVQ
jgi:D-alanyl-D-alanine dipeptidase